MKLMEKIKDFFFSIKAEIQAAVSAVTDQGVNAIPGQDMPHDSSLLPVNSQDVDNVLFEDTNEDEENDIEEVIEEEQEIQEEAILQLTKEVKDDKQVSGFDVPKTTPFGEQGKVDSLGRDLNIQIPKYELERIYLPPPTTIKTQSIVSETCCVRDLPILLIPKWDLIYTENDIRLVQKINIQGEASNGDCCEVPPPPEHNYWFTFTNCDGVAYIDLYIKRSDECDTETASLQILADNDCYSIDHFRINFLPGFEPECGCNLTTAISNVIQANSIYDFTYGQEGYHFTHFIDDCGVCWSIYPVSFENGSESDYQQNLYLVPLCAKDVEYDTICTYYFTEENQYGYYSFYGSDGYYDYFSQFSNQDQSYDSYEISFNVNAVFMEVNGNSILLFNIYEYSTVFYQGNYYYGDNNVNLVVDLPDNMGFDENCIEQFILCSEQYFSDFFPVIAKYSGAAFDDLINTGDITDETALNLALKILQSYAMNVNDPMNEPGFGVLEDNYNNAYKLCYDGNIDITNYNPLSFLFPDSYLTDVTICPTEEVAITNEELEICFCGSDIQTRFEAWKNASSCDNTYGDPFQYIQDHVDAHIVHEGAQSYLEINFSVLQDYLGNGYYETSTESFRLCIDEDIDITKLCFDTKALFENYYQYGYVNFSSLLNSEEPHVFLKTSNGESYTINYSGDDQEGPFYCYYELSPCEKINEISASLINAHEGIWVDDNTTISFEVNNFIYQLDFTYIHNENGTFLKINYFSDTEYDENPPATDELIIDITGTDLDCCCSIERLVFDATDVYEFVYNYSSNNPENALSIQDFLYYFSTQDNIEFYDCEDNCYDVNLTYEGVSGNEFALAPCNEVDCCKQNIVVEFEITTPTFNIGPDESQNCFDQFFDFEFIQCNDLTYIDFSWHYNYTETLSDCFNFPLESSHILISIPDEMAISCECAINKLIIPEAIQVNYGEYFQNCDALNDYVNFETGYYLIEILSCDRALFASDCGNQYIIDKNYIYGNPFYSLFEVGKVIATTTFTDENDFGVPSSYLFTDFITDYNFALQNGDGLSLREAIILANQYEADVDSILLESGTYEMTLTGINENESATGDFDVFNDLTIVGGCEGTVIDARGDDRAFEIFDASKLTLLHLTVQNGLVTDGGGGVYAHTFSALNLYDTTIKNSNGGNMGGGVAADDFVQITLNNSSVSDNIAQNGGGIYLTNGIVILNDDSQISNNIANVGGGGIYATSSTISLNDTSLMTNNTALGKNTGGGGAILASGSTITMNDQSSLTFNVTNDYGGAIRDNGGSVITLNDDSAILNNTSYYGGGGVFTAKSLEMNDNSRIDYNQTTNEDGGGVFTNGFGSVTLNDNSSISYNMAYNNGGGLRIYEVDLTLNDTSMISNNSAPFGGAIYDIQNSNIILNGNSSIEYNSADYAGAINLSYTSSVTLNDSSQISNNTATYYAGAIYSNNAIIELNDMSTISSNFSGGYAGAIYDFGSTDITLNNFSSISDNIANNYGGGIFASTSTIILNDSSTMSLNRSNSSDGGAIYDQYGSSITLYDNSNITNNTAAFYGGGVSENYGTLNLYDSSSITNNTAYYGAGVSSYGANILLENNSHISDNTSIYGGGIFDSSSTNITLNSNSYISGNDVSFYGGGIYSSILGTIILNDATSVYENTAYGGAGIYISSGSLTLNNNSLITGNEAVDYGGGVFASGGTVTLNDNSLITLNDADSNNDAFGQGGGIYNSGATLTINPPADVTANTPDDIAPPLVLDLNHDGNIQLISANDSQVLWDIFGSGNPVKTGWVGPEDGILIYDKNNDGLVTDVSEFMFALYHPDAKTDLEGLRLAFDTNHDNFFDSQDEHFSHFGVWQDLNSNGITESGEFASLLDWHIESLSLLSDNQSSIQEGNIIFGSSFYQTTDGSQYRLADVALDVLMDDVIMPDTNIDLSSMPSTGSTSTLVNTVKEQFLLPPSVSVQTTEEAPSV